MARQLYPAARTTPRRNRSSHRPELVGWGRCDAGWSRAWLLVAAGLVAVVLFGATVVGGWREWLPSLSNPFQSQTIDRSQPALLRSIQDLSRFVGASGNFQVVIDVENEQRFIPDVIVGERTLFVAAGTVDAYVEFGGLAQDAIEVDQANNAVVVTLPAAELARPNLDHERSYVVAQRRGAVNRFGDFFGNDRNQHQQLLQHAEQRLTDAAEESELRDRAAQNTEQMLVGMLQTLGFDAVTVDFVAP